MGSGYFCHNYWLPTKTLSIQFVGTGLWTIDWSLWSYSTKKNIHHNDKTYLRTKIIHVSFGLITDSIKNTLWWSFNICNCFKWNQTEACFVLDWQTESVDLGLPVISHPSHQQGRRHSDIQWCCHNSQWASPNSTWPLCHLWFSQSQSLEE